MDVINAIFKRRSVRKYLDKEVEKETITTLLKAAMAAPTAVNCQPWEYIVVDEVEKLSKIKEEFIPKHVMPLSIVYIGYPAEEKESRTQYDEKKVYWQEYKG